MGDDRALQLLDDFAQELHGAIWSVDDPASAQSEEVDGRMCFTQRKSAGCVLAPRSTVRCASAKLRFGLLFGQSQRGRRHGGLIQSAVKLETSLPRMDLRCFLWSRPRVATSICRVLRTTGSKPDMAFTRKGSRCRSSVRRLAWRRVDQRRPPRLVHPVRHCKGRQITLAVLSPAFARGMLTISSIWFTC
jgi:hypothetical protein